MIRFAGCVAGVLVVLLAAAESGADDAHYRGIPIGAHAIGLGGAFTGVADDVSAAFFNPGGLVLGRTVGLAAGLTVNAWERFDVERALDQPDGTARATTKTGRTVPIFVGAAVKFGRTYPDGERRLALALSIVEPLFSRGSVFFAFQNPVPDLSDSYRVNSSDRGTWYGLSFAGRINRKQTAGVSLYLSVRNLSHSEVGLTLFDGMPLPDDPDAFVGTTSAVNNQSLAFKAYHFILRFGWLYRIKPQFQLGLMVQPPGIPIRQRVDVFSQGFVNDSRDSTMPAITRPYFFNSRVDAKLPLPAEIEMGVEYWPVENVMLALDVSFHGPVRSGSRVETSAGVPIGGFFFDDETARRATGNVAVAGDFHLSRRVKLEAGFFTDFSSALQIPENPERFYQDRINRLGGTLSLGFRAGGIALAVGSTVLYGRGNATGVEINASNLALDFTRTEARSRVVYLHVTGATRAATGIGRYASEGVKARRSRKKEAKRRARAAEDPAQDTTPQHVPEPDETAPEPVPDPDEAE